MSQVERILTGLQHADALLAGEELEPDAERRDWHQHREQVVALVETLQKEVVELAVALPADALDDDETEPMRRAVAAVGGAAVAVVHASGIGGDARGLLAQLRSLAPAGDEQAELEAAERDLPRFCALVHGRWLVSHGRGDDAKRVFARVIDESREKVLVEAARVHQTRATPLRRGPELFRYNGFGVGLYGARDHVDDSYVATYCVSALWIPVFPLAAYRVADSDDGGYWFFAKEPLSRFAIQYRRLIMLAAVVLAAWAGIGHYMHSPGRRAAQAIEAAAVHEQADDPEQAIAAYEAILSEYADEPVGDELDRVGAALARLYCRGIDAPLAAADVAGVDRAVAALHRFGALPKTARGDDANGFMVERTLAWNQGIDHDSPAGVAASLRLLDAAAPAFDDSAARAQRQDLLMGLATNLAPEWPVVALSLYLDAEAPTRDALDAAGRLLVKLGEEPELMRTVDPLVERWRVAASGHPPLAELSAQVASHRDAARAHAAAPGRAELLAGGDVAGLTSFLREHPRDQEIALALALVQAAEGDPDAAIATLTPLGTPGWLIPPALHALAKLRASKGELAQADQLLTQSVTWMLPRMQRLGRAYEARAEELERVWIERAQAGNLPSEFMRSIEGKSDAEVQELFAQYLGEALAEDPELAARKAAYLQYGDAVSMALSLGNVKLQRAGQSEGAARQALLAEAERLFLSIRSDAEGTHAYHLSLGQLYYRLGRVDEGEAEFAGMLAAVDPALHMTVAHTYRTLGQAGRAREVAERVWMSGQAPHASEAASLLAVMATNDDVTEMWYQRADQDDPFVRTGLLEVKARRLYREGRLDEADRAIAAAIDTHVAIAEHDPVAANNAAIALSWRYQITGRREHLERARDIFEGVLRVQSDHALIIRNAAEFHERLGMLEVLVRWIDTDVLRLGPRQAKELSDSLIAGPLADELRALARRNRSLHRSLELTAQQNILMPSADSGHQHLLWWHVFMDDVEALRRMRHGLALHPGFAQESLSERRWQTMPPEQQKHLLDGMSAEIERLEALRKRIGARGSAPTRAALELMESAKRFTRGTVRGDIGDLRAAVAALRRADELWPALGAKRNLVPALVHLSVLELAESSPELARDWEAHRNDYGAAILLHRAVSEPAGAELLASLRRHPGFGEAVALAKDQARERPTLLCWVLGVAAGDRELEDAGTQVFANERERLSNEIAALLAVDDPDAQARWALFESHAP
ncbi:hypothetical protein [Haliangium sp.]|uniref:hypothetical protein n=1 Tax=Haliangium sp. TaxID=2663208 RepID=UPI003D13DABB